ncbi:FAD-binding oxidoreductase [Leifsonia sp. NPDC080035]|uniref:FAD-binding oxidoreductase n=1 Tax=Leifsonia sp. NPDC080035 TaxID=3143936 RepID=A0AAU7G8E7_9MICO
MLESIEALRRSIGGRVIAAGDADYDAASRTPLAAAEPAVVVQAGGADDVRTAVAFAATSGMPLAVRGGGHSFAGFGTLDGGIVLDLAALSGVELLGGDRVRVGGGARWGAVCAALAPHGLVISSGDTASVGVGGLTLSGGIGWMVRSQGLALDSLAAVELVTAAGEFVVADRERNADLFWAVRGGGGNFGVVTAFEFEAHPGGELTFGRITFPAAEAGRILPAWAEYVHGAPDELSSVAKLANPFAGGREAPVEIVVAVDGDDDAARRVIDPIRRLGTVLGDDVARRAYADVLEPGGALPPGFGLSVRDAFVPAPSLREAMATLAEIAGEEQPAVISVHALGGAMGRVPSEETAFAHRDAAAMITTFAGGPQPALAAAAPAITRTWDRLAPHVSGAYANFLATASADDVAAVYPEETARRLGALKAEYDPHNVFARNHNIAPELQPAR